MLNFQMTNTDFDDDDEKLKHLHYLIRLLLPFLKEMHKEQEKEIETEASTQGNYSSYKTLLSIQLCSDLMVFLLIELTFFFLCRGITVFSRYRVHWVWL